MICDLRIHLELNANEMNKNRDLSGYLLQKAKNLYNRKCNFGFYVIDIESIVLEGEIEIISFNLSAHGSVFLIVSALCMQYNTFDIAVGCQITKIDEQGTLICANDHLNAKVRVKDQIYKTDELIPLIILKGEYSVYQSKISTFASDFVPLKRPITSCVIGDYSEMKLYNFDETDRLEAELKELENDPHKKKIRKKFDAMMFEPPALKSAGNIRNFKLEQEYVLIITGVASTDSNYYIIEGTAVDYPEVKFHDAHTMLVKNYNKSLTNMIRLLQYYDAEKFENDDYIWKHYASKK